MPMTREALDGMQCATPGCTEPHGPLVMHSRCHPKSPTWVTYADGVMTVSCAKCDTMIIEVAVANVIH